MLRFGVSFWFSIGVSLRGSRSSLFWTFIWVSCGYLLVSTGYFHGLCGANPQLGTWDLRSPLVIVNVQLCHHSSARPGAYGR